MTVEAAKFTLAYYTQSRKNNLTLSRVEAWKKMRISTFESPKLGALPPTSEAFTQNVLRAQYQLVLWYNDLELHPPLHDPTDHDWKHAEGSSMLTPTIVPARIGVDASSRALYLQYMYSSAGAKVVMLARTELDNLYMYNTLLDCCSLLTSMATLYDK